VQRRHSSKPPPPVIGSVMHLKKTIQIVFSIALLIGIALFWHNKNEKLKDLMYSVKNMEVYAKTDNQWEYEKVHSFIKNHPHIKSKVRVTGGNVLSMGHALAIWAILWEGIEEKEKKDMNEWIRNNKDILGIDYEYESKG